jgi:hypothetical protein
MLGALIGGAYPNNAGAQFVGSSLVGNANARSVGAGDSGGNRNGVTMTPTGKGNTTDFGPSCVAAYGYVNWWAGPMGTPYGGAFGVFDDRFEFRGQAATTMRFESISNIRYYGGGWTAAGIIITTRRGEFKFTFTDDDMKKVTQELKNYSGK